MGEVKRHDGRGSKGGFPKVGIWGRTVHLLRDVRHKLYQLGAIKHESDAECIEYLVQSMARGLKMDDTIDTHEAD